MKPISLFALLLFLISCVGALPIPTSDDEGSTPPSRLDKGKGKAPASPPPSRPHTPTPATDSNVPLPGRNGVHHDPNTGISTAYYGDDRLPEHMGHIQRNQALHPGNRQPMPHANDRERTNNREEALHGIPVGGKYRNTDDTRVRDEKHLAMFSNKDHSKTTTVEYVPQRESYIEGGLASTLKGVMEQHGSMGQIRPNPGWLALNPHQRIAHEAPAALPGTQKFRPKPEDKAAGKSSKSKPSGAEKDAEADKKAKGYTPTVGASGSGMELRHREGVKAPPPPIVKDKKPAGAGTNLVPGRVSPPGHLWHPNTAGASHAGAPVPVRDSHTRQPTRPQDHDHYMRQQAEAHAHAQAALQRPATPAPHPHPGPPSVHPQANTEKFKNNLAKFNAQHPPTAANAHHGPGEAPGRMQMHTTPQTRPRAHSESAAAVLPHNHAAPAPAPAHPHQPVAGSSRPPPAPPASKAPTNKTGKK